MATASSDKSSHRGSSYLELGGRLAGRPNIALNRPVFLIGSKESCKIHLKSTSVSSAHALLVQTRHHTYLRDLASRTGTTVNGQRIREIVLNDGDRIGIGSYEFTFHAGGQPQNDEPTPPGAQIESEGSPLPMALEGFVTLIGRRKTADIPLTEESVSTNHAAIFAWEGRRFLRDLGSRTGTFLNGKQVVEQTLKIGDVIKCGETELHYLALQDDAIPTTLMNDESFAKVAAPSASLLDLSPSDLSPLSASVAAAALDAPQTSAPPHADDIAAALGLDPVELGATKEILDAGPMRLPPVPAEPPFPQPVPATTSRGTVSPTPTTSISSSMDDLLEVSAPSPVVPIRPVASSISPPPSDDLLVLSPLPVVQPPQSIVPPVAPMSTKPDLIQLDTSDIIEDAGDNDTAVAVIPISTGSTAANVPPSSTVEAAAPAMPLAESDDLPRRGWRSNLPETGEVIEHTDPAPESAQSLAAESKLAGESASIESPPLTDTAFGRDLVEFAGDSTGPLIDAATTPPAEIEPEVMAEEVPPAPPIELGADALAALELPASPIEIEDEPAASSRVELDHPPIVAGLDESSPSFAENLATPADSDREADVSALPIDPPAIVWQEQAGASDDESGASVATSADDVVEEAATHVPADARAEPIDESPSDGAVEELPIETAPTDDHLLAEESADSVLAEVTEEAAETAAGTASMETDDESGRGASNTTASSANLAGVIVPSTAVADASATPALTAPIGGMASFEANADHYLGSTPIDLTPAASPFARGRTVDPTLDAPPLDFAPPVEEPRPAIALPSDAPPPAGESAGADEREGVADVDGDFELVNEHVSLSPDLTSSVVANADMEIDEPLPMLVGEIEEPPVDAMPPIESGGATFDSSALPIDAESLALSTAQDDATPLPLEAEQSIEPVGFAAAPVAIDVESPASEHVEPLAMTAPTADELAEPIAEEDVSLIVDEAAVEQFDVVELSSLKNTDAAETASNEIDLSDLPPLHAAEADATETVESIEPAIETSQPGALADDDAFFLSLLDDSAPAAQGADAVKIPTADAIDFGGDESAASVEASSTPAGETNVGSATFDYAASPIDSHLTAADLAGVERHPAGESDESGANVAAADDVPPMPATPVDVAAAEAPASPKGLLDVVPPLASVSPRDLSRPVPRRPLVRDTFSSPPSPRTNGKAPGFAPSREVIIPPFEPKTNGDGAANGSSHAISGGGVAEMETEAPPTARAGRRQPPRPTMPARAAAPTRDLRPPVSYAGEADRSAAIARKRKLRIAVPLMLLIMLALMAATVAGIYYLVPVRQTFLGTIKFSNFDALSQNEQANLQTQQRDILPQNGTRIAALQTLRRASGGDISGGFLEDPDDYALTALDVTWPDTRRAEMIVRRVGRVTASNTEAKEVARVRAMLAAVYQANERSVRTFESAKAAVENVERDRDQNARKLEEIDQSIMRDRTMVESGKSADVEKLKADAGALEKTWNDALGAVKQAQADIERLKPAGGAPVDPASDDKVKQLTQEAADLTVRLEAARAARNSAAVEARKLLDEALNNFQTQIEAAKGSTQGNPELEGYVKNAQNLLSATRDLTDQFIKRQQDAITEITELKAQIVEKIEKSRVEREQADPAMRDLRERREIAERRMNAATGAGLKSEIKDLETEIRTIDSALGAQRQIIGIDPDLAGLAARMESLKEKLLRGITDDRKRSDDQLARLQTDFLAARPKLEKLPDEQKQIASAMDERLKNFNSARGEYARRIEESTAKADDSINQLQSQIAGVTAQIDGRKKDLALAATPEARTKADQGFAAATADKQMALAKLVDAESSAKVAYFAKSKELRDAAARQDELAAADTRLQKNLAERSRLQMNLDSDVAQLDLNRKNRDRTAYPIAPIDSDVAALPTRDDRPVYAGAGVIAIGVVFVSLILLTLRSAALEARLEQQFEEAYNSSQMNSTRESGRVESEVIAV